MATEHSMSLQVPACLYGKHAALRQKARKVGLRCGQHYLREGIFPVPRLMREVAPGELILMTEVADFQREQPACRLYMAFDIMHGVIEAVKGQNRLGVRDAYETAFLSTAWAALPFCVDQMGPVSAQRAALRIQSVLRFWEPLDSARYHYKLLGQKLTLEALMEKSCGWAPAAWCPESDAPLRERLALAAERMSRATREESLAAIRRHLPQALPLARNLQHPDTLADPSFQEERLATIDDWSFERISAAHTSHLLWLLYGWDRELGKH